MHSFENEQPLDPSPIYEQVHQRLRNALMAGYFKPGEPLTLRGIAERFGVGVMPVRSAVRQLVNCGALEMPNSRSTRVPVASADGYRDVHNMRKLLEGEAAAEAAVRISQRELAEIEKLQVKIEKKAKSSNFQSVLQINRDYHFAIYRAASNPVMLGFIEDLWLRNGPYLALIANDPNYGHESYYGHHHALIRALQERRPDRARAALVADLEDAAAFYDARLGLGVGESLA